MSTCALRCAMFTDHSLFLPGRRVTAIGFVQLAAVLASQCLALLARRGSKPGGSSFLWNRQPGNASSESSAAKQMISTVLCLLFLSLLLSASFADIWTAEKYRGEARRRRRGPPEADSAAPGTLNEQDEERTALLQDKNR